MNLTLGSLLDFLRRHKHLECTSFTEVESYRGFYEDLGVLFGEPIGALDMIDAIESKILGEDFQSYKGGAYTATERTKLWRAEWGECGDAILSLKIQDGVIVFVLEEEEEEGEEDLMQVVERATCGFAKPGALAKIEIHAVHDNGRPPDQPGGQHTNGRAAVWVNVGGVWYRSKVNSYKTRALLEELMELGEFTKWEG